jgi:hypothetical protein
MNKIFLISILICILGASCQSSNQQLLVGKWKAVSLQNPTMDKEIAKAILDIDTFGNTDISITNAVNIDSFKAMRKQLLQQDIADQKKALQEISYTFSDKGIAYISDGVGIDSAIYTIEENNILKIDAPALTGVGDLQLFTITSLSDTQLTLQMAVGNDTSQMKLEKIK